MVILLPCFEFSSFINIFSVTSVAWDAASFFGLPRFFFEGPILKLEENFSENSNYILRITVILELSKNS